MQKYEVQIENRTHEVRIVEAESPEDAMERARKGEGEKSNDRAQSETRTYAGKWSPPSATLATGMATTS